MPRDDEQFIADVEQVAEADGRYAKEAYFFLFAALEHTVKGLGRRRTEDNPQGAHVTGRELLQGISAYGLDQFGPMTRAVFEHWGIRRTRDFGEMVFALVRTGLMGKTDEDRIEDFEDIYDFDEEFDWKRRRGRQKT